MKDPESESSSRRKRPYAEHKKTLRILYETANALVGPFEIRDLVRFAQEAIPLTYSQAVRAAQTLLAEGTLRVVDRIRYSKPDQATTLYEFVEEFRNVDFGHRYIGRRKPARLEMILNRHRLFDGDTTYVRLTDDDTTELVHLLYEKVYKARNPPVVIGIARGVYVPLRKWVDFCRLNGRACQDDTMLIESYVGPNQRRKPRLVYGPRLDLSGREVLLLDDVADSGGSLMLAKDYLRKYNPSKILTAALFQKAKSRFSPDYCCGRIGDEWVIFLGEEHEDGIGLYRKWIEDKVPHDQLISKLVALGYSSPEIRRIEEAVQRTSRKLG